MLRVRVPSFAPILSVQDRCRLVSFCTDFFVTRNEGLGQITQITREFLDKHKDLVRGFVVNGSMERHDETYCFAADKIEKEYELTCLRKINGQGTDEDVEAVKAAIKNL